MPLPLSLFEPVLSTEAMREVDRATIEDLGLPGRVLMEVAGRDVVECMERRWGPTSGRRVLVLCGKGNNGGDGLVVARVLHARGAQVRVGILGEAAELTADSEANLNTLRAIARADDRLEIDHASSPDGIAFGWPEWIVDALLGIGVTGALREPIAGTVRAINQASARVVSIDVPTGLNSDSGHAAADCVRADLTVAMAAFKAGLLVQDGPLKSGSVEVVEIGIPAHLIRARASDTGSAWLSTDAAISSLLPPRPHGSYKYSAGRVLVIAGSHTFPGAAAMSALAAARSGAGAVVLAAPVRARELLEGRLTEVMTIGLPETADGTLSLDALPELRKRSEEADAVVIGPGLGRHPDTQSLVRRLLPHVTCPVVIDADAINALAGHLDLIRDHAAENWILTPHVGEFRRLVENQSLEPQPLSHPVDLARRLHAVILLKGTPSVVGTPSGETLISAPTSPALATAGTGDVLAGMTAGFLAQGLQPAAAAIAALHTGGRAAEQFSRHAAPRSMMATDLLDQLPYVLPA